jgi:cytohesin
LADAVSETSTEAEQHFEKANEFQKLADYDAAITEYKAVVSLSPKSAIAQNAQYWIGQIYFETRRFDDALSAFQELVDEFPSSVVVPTTKVMIERVQQAKKNRALFEAAKKADIEQVKSLITQGADVDAEWGSVFNKSEGDPLLLRKFGLNDSTPLWHAVDSKNIDVVKLIIEADPNVNAGYWPPLCMAVDVNNTAIAKYLIDHGAQIDYSDWGPLQEASTFKEDNIEMVKLLIARGADINGGDWPALHTALMKTQRRDLVELLIQQGADVNAKDVWGFTPLYYAIRNDESDFVDILIAKGADVNAVSRGGIPLQAAVHVGKREAVQSLIEAGAYIDAKNEKGRTALHFAAMLDYRDILELLLDKGADVNAKDEEHGYTALHHAARLGKRNAAEMLIAKGANINAKDKQGHTPLYVAVNNEYKIAELLIEKGADSSIRTESGQTLLELAQQRKQAESIAPDMIFDGDPNSLFGLRIACGDVDGDGHDDILVGAMKYDNFRGRVYLFYGGPGMDNTADLILEGQNEGDRFGDGIACGDIDNDGYEDIVIGANEYGDKQGRAYLYWGGDRKSMDADADKIFVGKEEKGSCFGMGLPVVYDIDNDGYDDVIMGAYWNRADKIGRAYLYYGNTKELMDTSADLTFTGEKPGDYFGYTIRCGDVDNDGFGDIIIGGFARQGRAYLYYGGSKSNMDANADFIFEAQAEGRDYFGAGIVCVDRNRDGCDDIVIGAPHYNNRQGRAYLFHSNSKRSLDTDPDMVFEGEVNCRSYGGQVVCGDIDGDNVNDLIIGAFGSGQWIGRVYVYWGIESAGSHPKPSRFFIGENDNDRFGFGLACGDVNNDGFDDLVIGADGYKDGAKQGRAYLYYGGPRNK